jgi:NAD(P)-dependent dehydrogenase (short-subunit alcohol dehydrogenase family)
VERRFEGRVAIVTGAAGGIGRAAALRFAQEGASLALVDLATSDLEGTRAAVVAAGAVCLVAHADVTRSVDVEAYVAATVARFGRLDVLFNNAGTEGWVGPLTDYPEEIFDRVIAVNLKGVWLGMKYAIPAMRRQGGVIINTSSVAGLGGSATLIAYNASKHAVIGMTKSAALTYGDNGVRVNAICPSPIETRMMRSLERGLDPDDPEGQHARLAAANPMGRYGEPSEVAALVAFLASDEAAFINGGVYTIDGGSRAR